MSDKLIVIPSLIIMRNFTHLMLAATDDCEATALQHRGDLQLVCHLSQALALITWKHVRIVESPGHFWEQNMGDCITRHFYSHDKVSMVAI